MICRNCGKELIHDEAGWGHLNGNLYYCGNVGKHEYQFSFEGSHAEPLHEEEIVSKVLNKYLNESNL
jgi:hypothetical protein